MRFAKCYLFQEKILCLALEIQYTDMCLVLKYTRLALGIYVKSKFGFSVN